MAIEFMLLTYEDGKRLLKQANQFKKAVYPVKGNLTRVWFCDGECLDCIETPEQIAEKMKELQEERKGLMMNAETND